MRLTSHIIVILLLGTSFTTFLLSWRGVIWKIPQKYKLFWHDSVRIKQNETSVVTNDPVNLPGSITESHESVSSLNLNHTLMEDVGDFDVIHYNSSSETGSEGDFDPDSDLDSESVIKSMTLLVTPIKSAKHFGSGENVIMAGEEDNLVMLTVDRFLETKGGSDTLKATGFLFLITTFVSLVVMTRSRKEALWINHTTVLFQVIAFSSISINVVYCLMIYQFTSALNPGTVTFFGTGFYLAVCSMVVSGVSLIVTLLELLSEMAVNQKRVLHYESQGDQVIVISRGQEEKQQQVL